MSCIYSKLGAWIALSSDRARLFVKEIVRAGEYVKGDVKFVITVDTLKHWALTFASMKKNGVRVPIPVGHDGASDPEKNRGWVDSMYVSGDALVMIAEAADEEAAKAFMRSDVSVYSPEEFQDGQGRQYRRPITHVALCSDPVVPGLGRFIPLAASLNEGKPKMDWKKLAADIGIAEEITEANAQELITKHFAAMKAQLEEMAKKSKDADLSSDESEEHEEEPEKKLAASRSKRRVDPLLVSVIAENRAMRIDRLVTDRKISPAQGKQLRADYIGDENAALIASIRGGRGNEEFERAVKLLELNEAGAKGEKTGLQTVALSDPNRGADSNPLLKDAETRAKNRVARR